MYTQDLVSSSLSSLGLITLAYYISDPGSPSSTGSAPRLLLPTSSQSQQIIPEDEDEYAGSNGRSMYLVKPRGRNFIQKK